MSSPIRVLAAAVNHGRWVVLCTACHHAAEAQPANPYFVCQCGSAGVQFPPEREAIEATLSLRPEVKNQNWLPGESVADLRIENLLHGVKVPV